MRNFPREPPAVRTDRIVEAESVVAVDPLRSLGDVGKTWNSLMHEAAGNVISKLECRSAGYGDGLKASLVLMVDERK